MIASRSRKSSAFNRTLRDSAARAQQGARVLSGQMLLSARVKWHQACRQLRVQLTGGVEGRSSLRLRTNGGRFQLAQYRMDLIKASNVATN